MSMLWRAVVVEGPESSLEEGPPKLVGLVSREGHANPSFGQRDGPFAIYTPPASSPVNSFSPLLGDRTYMAQAAYHPARGSFHTLESIGLNLRKGYEEEIYRRAEGNPDEVVRLAAGLMAQFDQALNVKPYLYDQWAKVTQKGLYWYE
jgi:hypothetical protein